MNFKEQNSLLAHKNPRSVVVFDFETTGMSPQQGDRVIEIGAVRLAGGQIVAQFQSLINPEVALDPFITELTGISNGMLSAAPAAAKVMCNFNRFVAQSPLVAHNASFDKRFLVAEFCRYGQNIPQEIGCSMLAARRIFPDAPNHKLATLVNYLGLKAASHFHRALADASMTAALWTKMEVELIAQFNFRVVPFTLLQRLGRIPRKKAGEFLRKTSIKQQGCKEC